MAAAHMLTAMAERTRASSPRACSRARSASSRARGPGLGKATALELAGLGATVVGCGRREEPLEEMVAEVTARGRQAEAEPLDIRDDEAVDAFIDGVVERHGRIDLLVNNAGGQFMSPAEAITPEGLSHRDRAERAGHLADDPRRGDQGLHPPEGGQGAERDALAAPRACPGWSTPARPAPRSRT